MIANFLNIININVILSIVAISFYIIATVGLKKTINQHGIKQHIPKHRRIKITRLSKLLIGILTLFILTLIWGLNIQDIWVFSSVLFGLLGIAIFAVWSLLSNVFAAYILFFSEPFQVGDTVIFKDGDNTIKGEVIDMTTFYIKIKLEDDGIAIIPNNVTFQKTIIKYTTKA